MSAAGNAPLLRQLSDGRLLFPEALLRERARLCPTSDAHAIR